MRRLVAAAGALGIDVSAEHIALGGKECWKWHSGCDIFIEGALGMPKAAVLLESAMAEVAASEVPSVQGSDGCIGGAHST